MIVHKSVIYCIEHIATGRRYIGSTKLWAQRKRQHIKALKINGHDNEYLQRAWNKYGSRAFRFLVLETGLLPSQVLFYEQRWIDRTPKKLRFNIREKAESNRGCKEIGEKISRSKMGHPVSQETRDKLSRAQKGKKMPAGFGIKMSKILKGMKRTAEFGLKISARMKGKPQPWNRGKRPAETCRKISAAAQRRYRNRNVINLEHAMRRMTLLEAARNAFHVRTVIRGGYTRTPNKLRRRRAWVQPNLFPVIEILTPSQSQRTYAPTHGRP